MWSKKMDAKGMKETNKVNEAEETEPEVKTEVKSETKAETKPEVKTEVKSETKAEAKPEVKDEVKSEAQEKPQEVSVKKGTGKKKWSGLWLLVVALIVLVGGYCCIANY